jgi:LysR family transcriptional regulator AphB
MDLNDISLFVSVVRAGSFAEAGRNLGVPASTCSRRIRELERGLGVRLMQRSTRRLVLTDAGASFFSHCAEQIDALTESVQQLTDAGEVAAGRVRVAAAIDFFSWFPMDRIADFVARYPRIRLEFQLNDAKADLMGDGIDVAFRAGTVTEPTLVARQVGWSQSTLVASPHYLAQRGTPVSPLDLAAHECITPPSRSGAPVSWHINGPDGPVECSVSGCFQANTVQAQLSAAIAGLGIALLPSMLTSGHVQKRLLQTVLPGYGLEDVGVYFVYLSRRHIPRAVSIFSEFVKAVMVEEGLVKPESCVQSARAKPTR